MQRVCTKEDVQALEEMMRRFFTRPPVLESTPPRIDNQVSRVLKTPKQIAGAWNIISEKRRLEESDDTIPITDSKVRARMFNSWMHEWLEENLTREQRRYRPRQKSSIFCAHLHNNYGDKHFVMAVWERGVQWKPPEQMLRTDFNGVIEHVAKNFALWTQKVARSITQHKKDPDTEEARRKSGNSSHGKHGLTADEEQIRRERRYHRENYY